MKNANEIQHRILVLESMIEEIFMLISTEDVTARQEADAEVVIQRLRNQIESLRWVLN